MKMVKGEKVESAKCEVRRFFLDGITDRVRSGFWSQLRFIGDRSRGGMYRLVKGVHSPVAWEWGIKELRVFLSTDLLKGVRYRELLID